ncbi:uncharacterized protein [Watersipora subatra]|uniref:uncharacterized protein n=1 Tax=Watersipora subatra TaxID=2589382 RepID=UPI00355C1058
MINAERVKAYKERIKEDSEKCEGFKRKKAEQSRIFRQKRKFNMTEEELEIQRANNRERKQKQREQKRKTTTVKLTPGPSPFGSGQSAGKALRKAEAALPRSPKKSAHVLKRLIDQYGPDEPSSSDSCL